MYVSISFATVLSRGRYFSASIRYLTSSCVRVVPRFIVTDVSFGPWDVLPSAGLLPILRQASQGETLSGTSIDSPLAHFTSCGKTACADVASSASVVRLSTDFR